MSEQTNQSSELSWGNRPVSVRDMIIMIGVIVLACIGTTILTIYVVQNPSQASPVTQTSGQSAIPLSQSAAQGSTETGEGQAIFQLYCIACHSIGAGIVVGPDLEGVTTRRDKDWLARWIAEPDKMLADGDPIATELFQEFNNIPMTNLGLSTADVEALIAYLDNPGGLVASSPTAETLPPGDSARGEAVFIGATGLQNGAPACISCHSTADVGLFGGGTLGPDLTNVQERYGEAGLPQTLQNLPFPTMRGVFGEKPLTDNEVADLNAYFAQANQSSAQALNYIFVMLGLAGFGILMLISQLIWRKRLKEVRKPLLGEAK